MINDRLKGLLPVIPTPFKDDQSLDLDGIRKLLDRVLENGITGITLLGSTSEAAYLSSEERSLILKFAIERLEGRAAALVGIIHWSTKEAVEEARLAEDLGAAALLVALPQYYATPLDCVIRHYEKLTESVRIPVFFYHYPETTGLALTVKEMTALFERVPLAGSKESGFSTPELKARLRTIIRPVSIFTGQSFNLLDALEYGAAGAIDPVTLLMPKTTLNLLKAFTSGEKSEARRCQERIHEALPIVIPGSFNEWAARKAVLLSLKFGFKLPKPPGVPHAGIKEALASAGIISSPRVRDPQPGLSQEKILEIRKIAARLLE